MAVVFGLIYSATAPPQASMIESEAVRSHGATPSILGGLVEAAGFSYAMRLMGCGILLVPPANNVSRG